jgi:hemin uptake protein HemP
MALKETELATTRSATPPRPGAPTPQPRVIDSRSLFGDQREVRIEHNGELYLLRLTRLGKLILTK